MQRLPRRTCHAAYLAREQGMPLKFGYDAILPYGLAHHEA